MPVTDRSSDLRLLLFIFYLNICRVYVLQSFNRARRILMRASSGIFLGIDKNRIPSYVIENLPDSLNRSDGVRVEKLPRHLVDPESLETHDGSFAEDPDRTAPP